MNENRPADKKSTPESREERLKAALKANMGRRKAQARARAAQSDRADESNTGKKGS